MIDIAYLPVRWFGAGLDSWDWLCGKKLPSATHFGPRHDTQAC